MKIRIQVVIEDENGKTEKIEEIAHLERGALRPEDLGLTLTLWRDWLTPEVLAGYNLNERQLKAVAHIKGPGRITNSEYQEITGGIRKTAARDLDDLVEKGVFARLGEKRGSYYILAGKK